VRRFKNQVDYAYHVLPELQCLHPNRAVAVHRD